MLQVFGRSSKFKKWLWKWGVFGYIGYGAYIRADNSSTRPSIDDDNIVSFFLNVFVSISLSSSPLFFPPQLTFFYCCKNFNFPHPTLTDKQHSSASPRPQPATALKKYLSSFPVAE